MACGEGAAWAQGGELAVEVELPGAVAVFGVGRLIFSLRVENGTQYLSSIMFP